MVIRIVERQTIQRRESGHPVLIGVLGIIEPNAQVLVSHATRLAQGTFNKPDELLYLV